MDIDTENVCVCDMLTDKWAVGQLGSRTSESTPYAYIHPNNIITLNNNELYSSCFI